MRPTKVERIRGVNDVLSKDCAIAKQLEDTLFKVFESFAYHPIDVPLIEYTELYLKKSGEDIADRLYDFTYRNRRLCLRPEITASAIRAYIDNLQAEPLPVRLYYSGPAFRYERPQKGRSRQFTQIGIELIGAKGAMADAEAIALAGRGLDAIGLSNYRLSVGHISVLANFLNNLQLENRLQSFLMAHMESLRKDGRAVVEERLCNIYPAFERLQKATDRPLQSDSAPPVEAPERLANPPKRLIDLLQAMDETDSRAAMLDLLASMNIGLGGSRDPAEIVDRLLIKMQRPDRTGQLDRALNFMGELGQLVGEPASVLAEAETLLSSYGIEQSGLAQLKDAIDQLEAYQLDPTKVYLDLGLSRGLQYYTGMVFEIHHGTEADEIQLCGGGRYDDLVLSFGGQQQTPATGFSYGLERLRLALATEGKHHAKDRFADILVVPVSQDDCSYAIRTAERLRQDGLRVEIDVRSRNVSNNLQYASKQNIPFAIVVGPDERKSSAVVLRDMRSREQQCLSIDAIANQIALSKESHQENHAR